MNTLFWERVQPTPHRREEQVIDAVMRLCESLTGGRAENIWTPDRVERHLPAVDRHFTVADTQYAVEHTAIQAFDNEYNADANWRNILEEPIEKLEDYLSKVLPSDSDWELWVPARVNFFNSKNVSHFLNQIKDWVVMVAPSLGNAFPDNVIMGRSNIGRRSVPIRLGRYPLHFCSNRSLKTFHIERMLFVNESRERVTVIYRAFERKAPKLAECRLRGAFAILVLEWSSSLATPAIPILYAANILHNRFQDSVDRVVVVSTDEEIWNLQYYNCTDAINNDIHKYNWWLYDPIKQHIWQRTWI
ncbi:hypothetical protein [Defluviicoccus vanus]|uniref:Uncharacterized protein n=1 Tax=Defluviicoccus vanus TaxID=111831 RepID=A0A7H1MYR7_9PROT|nr:hypothetical protein [Defluviicoccus vanus]QNT68603.1 hypothetical protein HQ394_03490 [Defluviicoccus vanus]